MKNTNSPFTVNIYSTPSATTSTPTPFLKASAIRSSKSPTWVQYSPSSVRHQLRHASIIDPQESHLRHRHSNISDKDGRGTLQCPDVEAGNQARDDAAAQYKDGALSLGHHDEDATSRETLSSTGGSSTTGDARVWDGSHRQGREDDAACS